MSEKVEQKLVDDSGATLILTKDNLIIENENDTQKFSRDQIKSIEFIKGIPDGALNFKIANQAFDFRRINHGRVFDFVQEISKTRPNRASYDSTKRFENNYLSNLDHAEEIDNLRQAMEDGEISHYEYDDFNPSISKAGK